MPTLLQHYQQLLASKHLQQDDGQLQQLQLLQRLLDNIANQQLWQTKSALYRWACPRPVAKSVYIFGGVGGGKSMLMDLFFAKCAVGGKRRVHFHAFMQEVHDSMHQHRLAGYGDPLPQLVNKIAADCQVLCFDEFLVTDIADAMLLGRLFTGLFGKGVVMVITSNQHPDQLYEGGLQRELFLPFIALLKQTATVAELNPKQDYRLLHFDGRLRIDAGCAVHTDGDDFSANADCDVRTNDDDFGANAECSVHTDGDDFNAKSDCTVRTNGDNFGTKANCAVHADDDDFSAKTGYKLAPAYDDTLFFDHPIGGNDFLQQRFDHLRQGKDITRKVLHHKGRRLVFPTTSGGVLLTSFAELCDTPHSSGDFLLLAKEFHTILLADIPQMNASNPNSSTRFTKLIDILYDHKTTLLATSQTPITSLHTTPRTLSRLIQLSTPHN